MGVDGESAVGEGSLVVVVVLVPLRLILRLTRRSLGSLGAPVAQRTRSGSTWNMSPGFSW